MRHGRPMMLVFARLLSDERSMAGQKVWFPGLKGITRFTRDSVPWILSAALRSRRLNLPMQYGICR
jgi:hypothetical protein